MKEHQDTKAVKIHTWMNMNKDNYFVQNLGSIWLRTLIRKNLAND